ncbi:hypothetical protein ACX80D_15835 [Arthrobacter sp. Sr24]
MAITMLSSSHDRAASSTPVATAQAATINDPAASGRTANDTHRAHAMDTV